MYNIFIYIHYVQDRVEELIADGASVAEMEILPIHSMLPSELQAKIFKAVKSEASQQGKVVVATNMPHICTYVHMYICTYIHKHPRARAHTHTHTHTHTQTHSLHIHTYIHIYIYRRGKW